MLFGAFPYRLRGRAVPLLSLVLSASLAACGATSPSATPVGSSAAIPSIEPPFPRTLIDDAGGSVTISARPQRIVALTPASVETLATLEYADRVVGIAECTCTPDALAAIPVVAGYEGVDLEQLIALEPDLVEDLADLAFADDQRRRHGERVADDAEHDVVVVEAALHRLTAVRS